MNPEQLSKLFQAFEQADKSRARNTAAPAWAWPSAESFCRMMGGEITVQSESGKGSTFTVTLPSVVESVRSRDESRHPTGAFDPMTKLLLVEDNEMNRDMLSRRLERKGYAVAIAVNGQQAVDMAAADPPALVLMDMSLPVLDGWEATRRIKANAATRSIPIIALPPRHARGRAEGQGSRLR